MDERLLKARQNAHAPCGCGDELEFVGRVDLGALGEGDIEAAQNDGGRVLEQSHSGAGHGHEDQHGRGDGYGEGLGAAQGERFGHQLAHHHVKIGDEGRSRARRR
jgi:hypothetical protein